MDLNPLLDLLLESVTLKRMPRTGWATRGVPNVESVAEHSFGVAFAALALVEVLATGDGPDAALDRDKVLIMALLHDLAEVRLTDLPSSARHLIPPDVKSQAESSAMSSLLAPLPTSGWLQATWAEFEDEASLEGRLVRDVDKLEMMVQCLRYEMAGSRGLGEFWRAMDQRQWHTPLCASLYAELRRRREDLQERRS